MVEHSTADLEVVCSGPIRGSVFMKNFQEFLMTVQEKYGKFECSQNQRRQLLEQFNKVEPILAHPRNDEAFERS